MPTYLTPGVYVEEVPSANKPIEGVGTAVAAFVGLTPGGPVNKPMRISNWTQFAKIFGDPQNPENGPFMEGAFLAHSVYGFFQNGGQLAWIIRVGNEDASPRRGPRCRRPPTGRSRRCARSRSRASATRSRSRSAEEPGNEGKEPGDVSYNVVVSAGSEREEYPGVTGKKGRTNIATKVNAASKLIKLEETGTALPETRLQSGTYTLSVPSVAVEKVDAATFEGDVATRKGIGGVAALDEVTMLVMPDIVNLNGDGAQMRDIQGKMIAHCENAGGRMAILDVPPDLLPAGRARVADEHGRLRLEDGGAVLPVDRGHGPAHETADDDAAVGPHRRRVVARGLQARRAQGAGQRGRDGRQRAGVPDHRRPSRASSTAWASTRSGRSPAAASACGAPARCRATRSGATSTSGGCSTTSRSRS